jgi:predicted aspartyl protease
MLDTGSSNTVFYVLFKHELGKPKSLVEVKTTSDSMVVQTFDALPAFVGPFSMQNCGEVTCLNLKMLTLIAGKEISGLIGMNFLRKHVLRIDFNNGRLILLKTLKETNFDWGEEFTISFNLLGLLQIKGNVLGYIKADFTIDTGSNATGTLDRRIFEEILSKEKLITSETLASTPSGLVKSSSHR